MYLKNNDEYCRFRKHTIKLKFLNAKRKIKIRYFKKIFREKKKKHYWKNSLKKKISFETW